MKKPAARVQRYNKVEKPPVICFCCTETFAGNQLLDAHLQRRHPYWFQDTLRKVYLHGIRESVDVVQSANAQEPPARSQAVVDSVGKLA
jgi:hypothetical protein